MILRSENRDMVFSSLSGYNFYNIVNQFVDEYEKDKALAVHELNGSEVEIRYDANLSNSIVLEKWKYFIEHPIDISSILWPVDIIRSDEGKYGLVFRRRAFPPLKSFKEILYNDSKLDWRNTDIQRLINNFLDLCSKLHNGGYVYHCFDIDRMRYNPKDMSILFDFSLSMTRKSDDVEKSEKVSHLDVGIEFLAPWQELLEDNMMTLIDDYYSITAILFRLMIGRMPYQGRLMDGNGHMMNYLQDTDENNHITMFRKYREQPVFIFDDQNKENAIGIFSEEEIYIERWNALPESIKKMFNDVLNEKNVKKDAEKRIYYSPDEWLNILNNKCFCR